MAQKTDERREACPFCHSRRGVGSRRHRAQGSLGAGGGRSVPLPAPDRERGGAPIRGAPAAKKATGAAVRSRGVKERPSFCAASVVWRADVYAVGRRLVP